MKNPIITIGIPAYNAQEWISDSIESALKQVELNPGIVEVIVCNDGSTDNTKKIIKSYPVEIIDQTNRGLPGARNAIIMNAKGDYFLPLDADDILLDDCVSELLEYISKTDATIIGLSFKEFGISKNNVILHPNITLDMMKTANFLGYCSAIKMKELKKVGGYNARMTYGWEDWDLWIDLLKKGHSVVTIPKPLWLYRVKTESMYTESLKHSEYLQNQIKLNHKEIW